MVYCTKCGTENLDDANICTNCGSSLNPPSFRSRSRRRDRDDDMCFGGRSDKTWPLLIGAFIILIGLSNLLDNTFLWARWDNLWPLFIIIIGLIIVYNAYQKR
jgi:uncharacterized membrane protein YvbJ